MAITSSSIDFWVKEPVWRPFTQMQTARPAVPIVRGCDAVLYSEDGREFLDGISSWWVNLHGHGHPYMVDKICAQVNRLQQVIFSDFTHRSAFELASRLLALIPGSMTKVFYSDNGSTAVETALKIAIQYWRNQDPQTIKKKVICFKGSYHGETFGAMAVSGRHEFHRPFWSYFFSVEIIDPPVVGFEERSLAQLKTILESGTAACFIFEPLILGVGGMVTYPAGGLDALLRLCRQHHVITIADEAMTGFGRTGSLFACESLKEVPDMMCLAKGLTGGFLPLGVTACQQHIFDAFLAEDRRAAFLHGHSYTGNPIACASAVASLDLLETEICSQQRTRITTQHKDFCRIWQHHPRLKRCESLGTILILEYRVGNNTSYFNPVRDSLDQFFFDRGIFLRPFGNILHVMPPYCITQQQLQSIYDHIAITLEESLCSNAS